MGELDLRNLIAELATVDARKPFRARSPLTAD